MPKPYTNPTLYDKLNTLSITFLKKHGYLVQNQWKSGIITWKRNGIETSSISISVSMISKNPFITLAYKSNEKATNYNVNLVSAPSNLGNGFFWFFICPKTGKRCRKLYLSEAYFCHRSAIKNCMYSKQSYSKLGNAFDAYFGVDELYRQLHQKHFKQKYAGKPTKRYLKIKQQIQKAENSITWR